MMKFRYPKEVLWTGGGFKEVLAVTKDHALHLLSDDGRRHVDLMSLQVWDKSAEAWRWAFSDAEGQLGGCEPLVIPA